MIRLYFLLLEYTNFFLSMLDLCVSGGMQVSKMNN